MADFEVVNNLDLKGNHIKNGGFEVFTTIPTTYKGEQITYDNKVWTWDGVNSKYICNESWIRLDPHDYIDNLDKYRIYKIIDINPNINSGYLSLTIQIKGDYNYDYEGEWRLSISKYTSTKINTYLREISPRRYVSLNIYVTSDGVYLQAFRTRWLCQVDIRIYNRYPDTNNPFSLNSTLPYSYDIPTNSFLLENSGSVSYNSSSETFTANENPVFDNIDINQTINFDTSNIEPTQTGTVTKTSTWTWQYLVQSVNFLWLKLKDLFPTTQATTHNYIPKIDNANKKLVKSNIYDNGTNVGIGTTTLSEKLHVDGNVIANGYKVGSGTDTKLLTDGGGTKLITDFAALEDGKIKASNLPDYLLGQVIYGGSINSSQTCTLSSLYKDKFDTTDTTKLLSNLTALSHVGVYFIASGSFTLNGDIDIEVGDWVISDGNTWGKIDNTDAVASVNGQTGVVNLGYEDLGGMPKATDTEVGGIVLGFVPELDADLLDGKHASEFATSSQGAKADTALQSIDKTMVENVLTGFITSHDHNYTTYKIFDDSNGVFDANNIFEDVSYYVLNSTNSLNSASLPDELYGDGSVDNSILSPFWFDSSIIKDNNNINQIKQRIVRSGSSVTDSVDNRQNVISKCYIRVTRGLGAWTPWQRILTSYDEYNGQSDWNQTDPSQRNYIQNKPDIFTINNEVNNNASLDGITNTGVYPLIYGRLYEKTPNPACGTLSERNDLEGFLIVYSKEETISQQIHDTINNIFYIRSFDSQSNNWNYWEKIITCKASYGEQGNSPEVTPEGFDLDGQGSPVNTFYHIDTYTPGHTKNLTINISLDNIDNYLRNNGPDMGEFKITLMFNSPIDSPTLAFSVTSPSFYSPSYITNGTSPYGYSDISGLEIIIKWYYNDIIGGFLFSVYKVNIL